MWKPILISIILFIIFANVQLINTSVILPKPIECEFYNKSECPQGIGSCKQKSTICEIVDLDKPSHCFVLWSINNATGLIEVTMKGCFTNNNACNQTECVDNTFEPKNNLNFCCCKGDMCNTEHKWVPTTTTQSSEVENPQPEQSKENVLIIYVACVVIFVLIMGLICGALLMYKKNKRNMFDEIPTIEPEVTNSSSCLDLQKVQLIDIKARGRFGVVWCAQMKLNEVAVKIFPMQDKESFQTEHEIYKLPRMKYPNILEFIGAEKYTINKEFWLITAYHNRGSLCDYLKAHTVTWADLCKIAESMSRGLMHLHEEIPAGKSDGIKPAIAHRDFKSKNVLLKQDLTACIADFGLALVFQPGKACGETHGQVGTRRYMAPEVLEGAINFTRDAFLRIDVYACGLVLWELVSRCTAHGGTVGEYMLPFEAELGVHPTLEEMQENVVMKKLRPRIEEIWRTHSGISAVCDTMEECWDHDAEARLSSSCVMERISQHTKYPTTQLLIETNTDVNSTLLKDTTDNSM